MPLAAHPGQRLSGTMRRRSVWLHPAAKPLVFVIALLPFCWLLRGALADALGPNPAEALMRATGDWTLRFICLTLAISPLRQWVDQPALMRFRRMIGLFAFFYACIHFLCYAWLDMGFDAQAIVRDIPKVLLLPLAGTSFARAIRALGARRWQRLHRLVYAVAALGVLHFFWMRASKRNVSEVLVYAAIVALLLGWRLRERWWRPRVAPAHSPVGR
jgi:sulfoxide reductase heme-binding subunit YedZ